MKYPLLSASCLLFATITNTSTVQADTYFLKSPNSRLQVNLNNSERGLSYSVSLDGKAIISESALGLIVNNKPVGNTEMEFLGKQDSIVNTSFTLLGRTKNVADHYNTHTVKFAAKGERKLNLNLIVRAYDEGVAIRYQLPNQAGLEKFTIQNEMTRFLFASEYNCFGFNQGKMIYGHEGEFDPIKSSSIRSHNLYDNPLVCKTGVGETTFALAESDLRDYPGAYFTGSNDGTNGVEIRLTYSADNLNDGSNYASARVNMPADGFNTAWRVIMVGDTPGKLTESSLIATLGEPTRMTDTSWIKPGKAAWDWWNGSQVVLRKDATVSEPGMNTDTFKAYIDFAVTLGLEYILIDEGWYQGSSEMSKVGSDVIKTVPEIDMSAIISYAKNKNVGVWVWLQWKQLDWQMEAAIPAYEKWGVKGIKVDFMDRSDQDMVGYYHKLLSLTGKHRLMVDLHGAFPPNGLVRTYPHFMTQEGVLGAEYNKWSARATATNNVTLPFTRMILGPIDYTPGGFRHATPEDFPKLRRNSLPYVQTTRGQAVAMYVVYDSPFQMLADSPITYSKSEGPWPKPKSEWEDGLELIKDVPTVWDETRILEGDIGQYIVSARRKGKDWYLGAMTNEQGRSLTIPLNFLSKGNYKTQIWQDGKTISTLDKTEATKNNSDAIILTLAPSGGAVVVLRKK